MLHPPLVAWSAVEPAPCAPPPCAALRRWAGTTEVGSGARLKPASPRPFGRWFAEFVGGELPRAWCPAAMMAVHRSRVRHRPRSFYKTLLAQVMWLLGAGAVRCAAGRKHGPGARLTSAVPAEKGATSCRCRRVPTWRRATSWSAPGPACSSCQRPRAALEPMRLRVGSQTETQRDFSVFLLSCQHVHRPVCFPPALLFVYDPFNSSCISCSRRNALMDHV